MSCGFWLGPRAHRRTMPGMARTAPAPTTSVIPGMNPGVFVLGGGGGGGGNGGPGGGGAGGDRGGGGAGGGGNAGGNGKCAPDPQKYPECGTVSHPIDVVTGRVFTHPIEILSPPAPLPLVWTRSYSSAMALRDAGFGYGWGHT